jgi:hypothetical protein
MFGVDSANEQNYNKLSQDFRVVFSHFSDVCYKPTQVS